MKPSSARMTHFLLCIYDVTGTKVLLYFIYSVPTKSHYDISMQYKCKYKKIIGGWFIFKRVSAMFICQESGRHAYLSREWPPCLFVKRVVAMLICQEIGRHVYFLIYRRHMIYFQHNTNKNIFLTILEISVTVYRAFLLLFTDVRKDTMVYGKPDCYSFLYHESLIRSILFVPLFRKF